MRRVGEDVSILAPHRPGRADFPHPVPRARASLTMSRVTIAIGHPAPPRLADRKGIHAFSSVWLSMSFRGQGLQGSCPFPCFPAWSSPRDASLPSFGSRRARFPAVTGTMKALRLPICAPAVAYWFRFHCPRDPPAFVSAVAFLEGRRSPPGPGFGCRPPVFPAVSCGRQWDLSGLQAILPVPLLRSRTPVEPTWPCH